MSSEKSKGLDTEIPIFLDFVRAANLSIDKASVQKRHPPEPDIKCQYSSGECVAFELVEICDKNMAKNREDGAYIRTSDPSLEIVRKKLNKNYETSCPIELLCYKNGRVVSPDS